MILRFALLAASVFALLSPTKAFAQAWAGQEGQLVVGLTNAFQSNNAVFYGGRIGKITDLTSQQFSTVLDLEFTPIENLSIGLDATYFATKYTGPESVGSAEILLPHGANDDGNWHGDLQDLNINARYQVVSDPVVFSPQLNIRLPMKDYVQQGYAATGTGLKAIGLGVFLGRAGIGTENLFAEGGYQFNYVERLDKGPTVDDYSAHFSIIRGTIGYFFGDKFTASVGLEFRQPHGGIELADESPATEDELEWHDPILARQYILTQVLASYALADSLNIGLGFGAVLTGRNVSDGRIIALNIAWNTSLYEPDVEPPPASQFDPEAGEEAGSVDPDDY